MHPSRSSIQGVLFPGPLWLHAEAFGTSGPVCTFEETCDLSGLPELPRREIQLVANTEFWDGPLAGLALFRGERVYFHIHGSRGEPFEPPNPRKLVFYRLTPEGWGYVDHWRELFVRYVGTHADYDEAGRPLGAPVSRSEWRRYFELADGKPVHPDLGGAERVGWSWIAFAKVLG